MYLIYNEKTKQVEPKSFIGMAVFMAFSPYMVLWQLAKHLIDSLTGKLTQDDTENIKTIIAEGRKQKVEEMEIEMSRKVAMGLNISDWVGNDVTIGTKGETKYVIKVRYKYD